MAITAELTSDEWERECFGKREMAVGALVEMVDGASPGDTPRAIPDPVAWVHTAFYLYRSGMGDNDPKLPRLARLEHDFIAALGALNFDAQERQLRMALQAMRAFGRTGFKDRPLSKYSSLNWGSDETKY